MKTTTISAALLASLVTGCGGSKQSADHDHGGEHAHHVHQSKMGGQLVEVGEHAFNLELLSDRSTGQLTLWLLDDHAESFVRVTNESFTLLFSVDGKETPLQLNASANPATGERVGETAQFDGRADFLKTTNALSGWLPELTIRGSAFSNLTFQLRQ
jgi:hypothetical protein